MTGSSCVSVVTLLTKNELISNPQLNAIIPNCCFKHSFFVVYFDVDYYLYSTEIKKRLRRIDSYYKVKYKKIDKSTIKVNVLQLKDTVFFVTENGDVFPEVRKNKTYGVNGNCLNYAHLTIIENMKTGDKIVFENITVRSTDGANLRLPPLIIYIE